MNQTTRNILQAVLVLLLSMMIAMKGNAQTDPCGAKTKAGLACKAPAKKNGYCMVHDPQADRCGAKTTSGSPCRVLVKEKGMRCRFHK